MAGHVAPTREPLLSRAAITAVVGLAVALGLVTTDVGDALIPVLVALAPVVAAVWTRKHVTPLADPQTNNGIPLVPAAVNAVEDLLPGDES